MSSLSPEDLQAVWLTLKLACVTTIILLLIATPLAWWLAHKRPPWAGRGQYARAQEKSVALM